MASTGSGFSDAAFVTGLLVIAFLVLLLLRHYLPLRSTPAYLLLPIFLALFLPASIVLLVPIDLASAAVPEDGMPRGILLPDRARLVVWRIVYWLLFLLTWFLLPILGQYSDSGSREPQARLMYSLKSNGRYQLIMVSVAALGLTYAFLTAGPGVSFESFKSMVMALPYAWGLILAIYLMGHGLVSLPRQLYRAANISGRLRDIHTRAPRMHERLIDSVEDLQVLEAQVLQLRQRKTGTALKYQDWIEDLVDSSDMPESRIITPSASRNPDGAVPVAITDRYMSDLTRKLKRARHRRIRFVKEWDACVQEAKWLQGILDASGSRRLETPSRGELWFQKTKFMTPGMRYHLNATIMPAVRIMLSAVFTLAAAALVWSEVVPRLVLDKADDHRLPAKFSLVSLSIIHHPNAVDQGKIGFAGQVIAGCWMLYMVACTLLSIRQVKIWGNRALVTRHTYAESACWYAAQVARLTIPLSYNFTSLVPSIFEQTRFYQFLGQPIDLTSIGEGFSSYFPILIVIPVLANTFNLYGKVQGMFGYGGGLLDDEEGDNPSGYGTGSWREGKALIDRELNSNDALGLASRAQSPRPTSLYSSSSDAPSTLPLYRDSPTGTPVPAPLRSSTRQSARGLVDEDVGGGFFSDFAHRVRNTIDTVDKPTWISNVEFKKPKWMGGNAGDPSTDGSGAAESSQNIGRWFGGRPDNGKLRL